MDQNFRYSLKESVRFSGVGIHTGENATVNLLPADAGTGIVFRREGTLIPALYENVVDTARCTVLGKGDIRISTVEHLLSACAGGGITDLLVDVNGPELPIGDGSAKIWSDLISQVDRSERGIFAPIPLTEPLHVYGKGGAFVAMYPSEQFRATVSISFEHPLVATQVARFDGLNDPTKYATEVAPARTFGFIEEVEALLAAGLARGGSFDNAVIVYNDHYSSPLRFSNELACHKLLDLMGDLLLATGETLPVADIIAVKPSHKLNTEAARTLATQRT